jgi:hypothetical protein
VRASIAVTRRRERVFGCHTKRGYQSTRASYVKSGSYQERL